MVTATLVTGVSCVVVLLAVRNILLKLGELLLVCNVEALTSFSVSSLTISRMMKLRCNISDWK